MLRHEVALEGGGVVPPQVVQGGKGNAEAAALRELQGQLRFLRRGEVEVNVGLTSGRGWQLGNSPTVQAHSRCK